MYSAKENISLRWSEARVFWSWFYKHRVPPGLKAESQVCNDNFRISLLDVSRRGSAARGAHNQFRLYDYMLFFSAALAFDQIDQ